MKRQTEKVAFFLFQLEISQFQLTIYVTKFICSSLISLRTLRYMSQNHFRFLIRSKR